MPVIRQLSSKPATDKDHLVVLNKEVIPVVRQLIDIANGSSSGPVTPDDGGGAESIAAVDWNLSKFGDPIGHWIHGRTPTTDLSGRYNDLTVIGGSSDLSQSIDSENLGRYIAASWILENSNSDFRLLRGVTISSIVRLASAGATGSLACCQGPGAGGPDNLLYELNLRATGMQYDCEYGVSLPGGPVDSNVLAAMGQPVMLTCSRDANGVDVNFYINKMLVAQGTAAHVPEDGSASVLRLFCRGDGTFSLAGCYVYASTVYADYMSAADVDALYRYRIRA